MALPLRLLRRSERDTAKANRALQLLPATSTYLSSYPPRYTDFNSYLGAFKTVPWVRPCVSVIAYNAANVRLKLLKEQRTTDPQTGKPKVEDVEIESSPLLDLLDKPNPSQTRFELLEKTWMHLELTGNAYWSLEERGLGGRPTELYVLRPDLVTVLPDRTTGLGGYRYTVNGRSIQYEPEEMLHLRYPHPTDDLYGMGIVEAAEQRVDSARSLVEHERNFWASGAKIQGILQTDEQVDDTVWNRLVEMWRRWTRGSGYSVGILEAGIKYQSVSDGPAKLGMLEMAKLSRDEILALFGVPPTKVGILENANYKAQNSDEFFWTETIDPKLTRMEQGLAPLVELFHPGEGLRFEFERLNFSDDLAQAEVVKSLATSATLTLNELRAYQAKDPLPGGDVIIASSLQVPLVLDAAPTTAADGTPALALVKGAKGRSSQQRPASAHLLKRQNDKAIAHAERTYGPKLASFFRGQERRVTKALLAQKRRKALRVDEMWDGSAEDALLAKQVEALYRDSAQAGFKAAASVGVAFELPNERVDAFIGTLADRVTGINDSTRQAIDQQVIDGVRAGYAPRQIADGVPDDGYKGIAGVFDEASGYRATMIARTESMQAFSSASVLAYRESGLVEQVEILDGDFDEVCAERNGMIVPLDEADGYLQDEHPNGTMALLPVVGAA